MPQHSFNTNKVKGGQKIYVGSHQVKQGSVKSKEEKIQNIR